MYYEVLRKKLRSNKYRMTAQREAVLKIFAESEDRHLGVEDVYRRLVEKKYRVSKATVYRSIDLLAELGFLRKLEFGEGVNRYELIDQESGSVHHHFVCEKCGKIFEVDNSVIEKSISELEKHGFLVKRYDITFYGLCKECHKSSTNTATRTK
jgi:Fur family ferric uptake transcriptional regulator